MPTALYHLQSPTTSVTGGEAELHSFIYSVKICSFHLGSILVPIGGARHRGESAVGLPWAPGGDLGAGDEVCTSEGSEQGCTARLHRDSASLSWALRDSCT